MSLLWLAPLAATLAAVGALIGLAGRLQVAADDLAGERRGLAAAARAARALADAGALVDRGGDARSGPTGTRR